MSCNMAQMAADTRELFSTHKLPLPLRADVLEQAEFYEHKAYRSAVRYCNDMANPLIPPTSTEAAVSSRLSELYAKIRMKLDKKDREDAKAKQEDDAGCCIVM